MVRPGAYRIATEGWWYDGVTYSAFRNPDGSLAVIFYNANNKQLKVNITDGENRYNQVTLPPRAAVSVLLNTDQTNRLQALCPSPAPSAPGYYTLTGMKVDAPRHPGIFIYQGRKEIMK